MLAENERNPTAFFAGGVRYAYAPDREDQDNPFAYDNFNYFDVGGFLGMEWTFDPRGDALAIHRREAERDAAYFGLRAKRLQVELEVRKAFLQVESAARLRQAAESSLDAARDWVRVASDHWDLGLGEPDRLLRAYRSYFERESALLATEADFHSSLAGLAMASVGMDTYLRWTDVGDVVVP